MNLKSLSLVLGLAAIWTTAGADVVKIAVLAPLTGSVSAIGTDLRTGAQLAVDQRKAEFNRLGIQLETLVLDDKGDPTTGANLIRETLLDPQVLGIVGPTKSGISLKVGEVLAASSNPAPLISPSSTNDELTQKGWKFFHRVTAPDGAQADVAARYIARELKPKAVFLVGDNTTFSNFLVEAIARELKQEGIKVVDSRSANVGDAAGVQDIVARVKASGAELVFHAGLYDSGAPLVKALRAANSAVMIMGSNGLDSPDFIRAAQGDAAGVRFVTGLGPVENYTNGQTFISAYRKAFNAAPAARAVFTYDAMNAMLDALSSAARKVGKTPTRAQVNTALNTVSVSAIRGVTGPIAFTPSGERRSSPMFIVEIDARTLQPMVVSGRRHLTSK
ncbi:branched-chain amino acid ABC transporter substrate-binding protein [Deinococcus oregonensis]|uniref:Branched-chain amino acid ABC transporter substrate-binding protein n=1 Tax=Deinococcus oregonensis TaxID=1805970 RepID=A0ABV6AZB6_9DEIO